MIEPWQRTLIRSLFPYSADRLNIEAAFIAKFPHIPPRLYKYRSFTERHKEALCSGELWFSSPDNFNDPFDTTTYFDASRFVVEDMSVEESLKQVRDVIEGEPLAKRKPIANPIRPGEWQSKIFAALQDQIPEEIRHTLRDFLIERMTSESDNMVRLMSDHFRQEFSVLSLSADPLSGLMWSHYSDAHRGFCIEYNFGDLPYEHIRKRMCFPVFYRAKRTDATRYLAKDGFRFNNLFGQYLCLLKSSDWAYEQEWRIVHAIGHERANCALRMPPPGAILLGADAKPADAEWMQGFCTQRSIPLKRVTKNLSRQRLAIVDAG